MEIHHHSHSASPPAGRAGKKWTHYFWEFLMLFFAVFAGFLAENQREHYIEHQREKQFINSLINDVQADTAKLSEIIASRNIRESRLDSLVSLINHDSADRFTSEIYFLGASLPRVTLYQFTPTDGTIQQLKAGSLRLIRKKIVTDSIIKYDAVVKSLLRLDEQEQSIVNIQREMAPAIFNGLGLGKFADANNIPQRLEIKPPLMPGYKNSLNEFNYRLVSLINVNKGYRRESRKLLAQAINLLHTLKKEYHLK